MTHLRTGNNKNAPNRRLLQCVNNYNIYTNFHYLFKGTVVLKGGTSEKFEVIIFGVMGDPIQV